MFPVSQRARLRFVGLDLRGKLPEVAKLDAKLIVTGAILFVVRTDLYFKPRINANISTPAFKPVKTEALRAERTTRYANARTRRKRWRVLPAYSGGLCRTRLESPTRSFPKHPGRYDPQHGEARIQTQNRRDARVERRMG